MLFRSRRTVHFVSSEGRSYMSRSFPMLRLSIFFYQPFFSKRYYCLCLSIYPLGIARDHNISRSFLRILFIFISAPSFLFTDAIKAVFKISSTFLCHVRQYQPCKKRLNCSQHRKATYNQCRDFKHQTSGKII